MKQFKLFFLPYFVAIALAVAGCGEQDSGNDVETIGDGTDMPTTAEPVSSLGITADKLSVSTSNTDAATITILAKDENNAGISGATIDVSADTGFLSASRVVTDETGQGTVTFRAGDIKTVQVATVTATSNGTSASIPISIAGTSINVSTSKSSIIANGTDVSEIDVAVRDSGGTGIMGASLVATSSLGNTLTDPDSLDSGTSITVATDSTGSAKLLFSGAVTGTDTITFEGLGAQKTVSVNVSNSAFDFVSPANSTVIPTTGTQELVVRWTDDSGAPQSGQTLSFAAGAGTFASSGVNTLTTVTDGAGEAMVIFQAPNIANPVTIIVENSTRTLSDSLTLDVRSQNPARIDLQANPTVLSPTIGDVESTSTITATVRDTNGNAVAGANVNFELVDGPSGGEVLSPVTVITDSGGVAQTSFIAGSSTSAQNGVVVRATVSGLDDKFGETSLTIGATAARIVFGTTNVISTVTSNGLEVGYQLPITVVVTDNNGNAIPSQQVNLGIHPTVFRTGFWENNPQIGEIAVVTGEFQNEDENRNGILDLGEDGAKGYIYTGLLFDGENLVGPNPASYTPAYYLGQDSFLIDSGPQPLPDLSADAAGLNQFLDPGNVVTIPSSIVTDENGLAGFNITYPKSFGAWVSVALQATTTVSGSETKATLQKDLSVEEGDLPRINSPFGTP